MGVVVDASVALEGCFASERFSWANSFLDVVAAEGAIVPSIWPAEVADGLLTDCRWPCARKVGGACAGCPSVAGGGIRHGCYGGDP